MRIVESTINRKKNTCFLSHAKGRKRGTREKIISHEATKAEGIHTRMKRVSHEGCGKPKNTGGDDYDTVFVADT